LKACLIAGATRLPGTAAPSAILDNHQGFGRVNLDAVLAPSPPLSARFFEKKPGLNTGQIHTLKLTIKTAGQPLRVVMAYTDHPGPALVNNLNLFVTAPDGTRYTGNNGTPGGTSVDTKNNAEGVHVKSAAAGAWRVEIVASNVPMGPQDFALVCIGHL
jgi:serine protease AprX